MTNPSNICDACRRMPACYFFEDHALDGPSSSKQLCASCYSAAVNSRDWGALHENQLSTCDYCGRRATSMQQLPSSSGNSQTMRHCRTCGDLFGDFIAVQLKNLDANGNDVSDSKISKIYSDAEDYVRASIALQGFDPN